MNINWKSAAVIFVTRPTTLAMGLTAAIAAPLLGGVSSCGGTFGGDPLPSGTVKADIIVACKPPLYTCPNTPEYLEREGISVDASIAGRHWDRDEKTGHDITGDTGAGAFNEFAAPIATGVGDVFFGAISGGNGNGSTTLNNSTTVLDKVNAQGGQGGNAKAAGGTGGSVVDSGNSKANGGSVVGSGNSEASSQANGGSVVGSGNSSIKGSGDSSSSSNSAVKGSGNSSNGIGVNTTTTVAPAPVAPSNGGGMGNGWKNGALDVKRPTILAVDTRTKTAYVIA